MQPQEATTEWLFKLWPWFEANTKRIAFGAVFVVIAAFVISFYSYEQNKKEVDAGEAFTQALMTPGDGEKADAYLKVATDYPNTRAGQRALLQAAAALFAAGKYEDAQTQFQKFIDSYPDSAFAAQASLGVAASLNAQGKTDLAADAYQRTINQATAPSTLLAAEFALAQIDDHQGKISDALRLYEDVAQKSPNGSIGSEAGLRALELKNKLPASQAPAAPTTFDLSH
ncbi:MAG TPA: tetratricopeptide repeat protein [Candidatus Baltobacteraceae bacterium]|nr:tetratricopeptide repeat protein [Candidatus Baltobacteraceae bacterium]